MGLTGHHKPLILQPDDLSVKKTAKKMSKFTDRVVSIRFSNKEKKPRQSSVCVQPFMLTHQILEKHHPRSHDLIYSAVRLYKVPHKRIQLKA